MKAKQIIPKAERPRASEPKPTAQLLSQVENPSPKAKTTETPRPPTKRKRANLPKFQLPDNPMDAFELENLPEISREEILSYLNALYDYQKFQANLNRVAYSIIYKLRIGCKVSPQSEWKVDVDIDNKLVFTEKCNVCQSTFDPRLE